MNQGTSGRRSSNIPIRVSALDREDKNSTRNDQRRTQTKSRGTTSTGDGSHIPRSFRASSSDRRSSRKSYLKMTCKTSLHLPTTPTTSTRSHLALTNSAKVHTGSSIGRSPSCERANCLVIKGPGKDTRPLTDKNYQIFLFNKVDDFLRVNQCFNTNLKSLTLKMFVEITDFLIKFLNVKEKFSIADYIDKMPKIAKMLHYPGVMTKSWLKTANAQHSWPHVLGWFGWLVGACQVREISLCRYQLETLPFMGTEQESEMYKTELLVMVECYKVWNDGAVAEETEILENYLRDIEIQKGITEEDVAQAHKELEDEISKLRIIEDQSKDIDEEVTRLKEILSSLHIKEKQIHDEIESKENYRKKISAETVQLNAEHSNLTEQIHIKNKQLEELSLTIKGQSMSKVEKDNLVTKCIELQNYIHEFDEHLKDYQKESYALDIRLASSNNALNKTVLTYNKEVFILMNDIGANFDELKLPEEGFLDPQIMDILEEKAILMKNFKELLKKQEHETEILVHSSDAELEDLQEKHKSLSNKDTLQEEKSYIDQIKTANKKEKTTLINQIETLRSEIRELQNTMPDIEAIEREIEEKKDKETAVIRRQMFLEESSKEFFEKLYKIIGENRKKLGKILTK